MTLLDFTFEFTNEVDALSSEQELALQQEAQERLQQLGQGHTDLIGAAMSLESLTEGRQTDYLYQGRVVVYARPGNVVAVAKEGDPTRAMKAALSAVERQVRERREKLRSRSREMATPGANASLYELSAAEIYQSYAADRPPAAWSDETRQAIAARLMQEEQLNQGDALYAADQILAHAEEMSARS